MGIGNIELMLTGDLKPHPKNNNKHPKSQIKKLSEAISTHGFRVPVIVSNLSGYVVAGHGRLEAAKLISLEKVPVIKQDFKDSIEEYAFLTSDNVISQESSIDFDALLKDLNSMKLDFPEIDLKEFSVPLDFLDAPVKPKKTKKEITVNVTCPECSHEFTL